MGIFNFFRRKKATTPPQQSRPVVKHKLSEQQLEQLSLVFETLDRFRKGNLLYIDFKRKAVTISVTLAELFIYDDDEWQKFLHNIHLWAVCQWNISEYTRSYTKAMADAEASVYKEKKEQTTVADRKLARMQAAVDFDRDKVKNGTTLPDLHFYVLGLLDGEPICVARLLDGRYETIPIPDELKSEDE